MGEGGVNLLNRPSLLVCILGLEGTPSRAYLPISLCWGDGMLFWGCFVYTGGEPCVRFLGLEGTRSVAQDLGMMC